jgi:GTP cyclohydrolase IA
MVYGHEFKDKVEAAARGLIDALGLPAEQAPHLADTPARLARMYDELLSGYAVDPKSVLTFFENPNYSELILQTNIPFQSLCEHHLLPFVGVAHVGYIPTEKVVGLSKIPRIVEVYARRLQLQERLTGQIADALVEHLGPEGVIVVVEAEHYCMAMRGPKVSGSTTTTSALRGVLYDRPPARAEALALINRSK